jgi:uracil-DNA glycosylase family 4
MVHQPAATCALCPRLFEFRKKNQAAHPKWFNAPVPAFGALTSRLLIVGLAPGLRGANLTGRPFTGDYAGDLLYATLLENGFATGVYDKRTDDGLMLQDCRITNAVKCVPPENKPVGAEINTCNDFLAAEIAAMANLQIILTLGGIAHGAVLKSMGEKKSSFKFAHAAHHRFGNGMSMINSYHCSRYNTNTGRLTTEMFDQVFKQARAALAENG